VKAVQFGNGEKMTADEGAVLLDIEKFMMKTRVAFKWQKGDVIVIDNGVCMHSRNTFERPRRILAALGGPRVETVGAEVSGPVADMPYLTVRSGDKMPAVGMGFWKVPNDACADTVYNAIKIGYRHLDNACDYGNEKEVGDGIARAIKDGLVTRKELWITSKLWNTYHSPEHVEAACRRSRRLRLHPTSESNLPTRLTKPSAWAIVWKEPLVYLPAGWLRQQLQEN